MQTAAARLTLKIHRRDINFAIVERRTRKKRVRRRVRRAQLRVRDRARGGSGGGGGGDDASTPHPPRSSRIICFRVCIGTAGTNIICPTSDDRRRRPRSCSLHPYGAHRAQPCNI